MDFERAQHPYYEAQGKVKALERSNFPFPPTAVVMGNAIFCAIAIHEGRTIRWRSQASILDEARKLTELPDFKGYIQDAGGPNRQYVRHRV